jgi:hypothetical protein
MRLLSLFVTIVALTAFALMPLGIAVGQQASPGRVLPDAVHSGETFDVTVNFIAPADKFNAIVLSDLAPADWNVTVDETWCTPNADAFTGAGNKAEITWFGEPDVGFDNGTTFTALYKVTVPDDASLGIYAFNGSVEYYVGPDGPYSENTTGGSQIEVAGEGGIGLWWIITIVVGIAIIVVAVLVVRRRGI